MAVLKHIKSRNADYSAAIDYLLFQHDEKTGKKVLDEFDRSILREEFYMDGLNCDPMSFDKECQITNARFHKNQKRTEIKSHHYIISFDPADGSECGLTGKKAQALCLELAKKIFPGYQALIVTHTDGHNASGNIHTHIVINSVRKYSAEREPYMSQPHDHEAGYKHRSTDKFLKYFKQEVMDICHREGLHQIDLLQPAEVKITQAEYMTKQSGQDQLEKINQKIIEDGLTPTATVFQTQKQYLRNAIDECAALSSSFEDFQSRLLENYQISVTDLRGRYSYLHRTEKTNFRTFPWNQVWKTASGTDIFTERSDGCLIYQISSAVGCGSAVKCKSLAEFGIRPPDKITNLQQMANTIMYVQEHGIATQQDFKKSGSVIQK